MRPQWGACIAILACALGGVACSFVLDTDSVVVNRGPDGSSSTQANLLTNGDFELGCSGWQSSFVAVTEETTDVHGGTRACRFCASRDSGSALINHGIDHVVVAGQHYVAEAWVKAAGVPSLDIGLEIRKDGAVVSKGVDTTTQLSDKWQRASALVVASADGDRVRMQIQFPEVQAGMCFLIDDVRLFSAN